MTSFGERLKRIRRERNMSQNELAQKVGIARRLISRYETGASTPSTETLRKLADALGVGIDFLLTDPGDRQSVPIDDDELLSYFSQIRKMSDFDKAVIKTVIQALIIKNTMSD